MLVVGRFSLEDVEYETSFYFHDRVELDAVYIKPKEVTVEACAALRDGFARYVGAAPTPGPGGRTLEWLETDRNFVASFYESYGSRYGSLCSVSIRENNDIVLRRTRRRS